MARVQDRKAPQDLGAGLSDLGSGYGSAEISTLTETDARAALLHLYSQAI